MKGFADREGVALVATDNFDAAGDAEEPALRALEELVPSWRRRTLTSGQRDMRLARPAWPWPRRGPGQRSCRPTATSWPL